VTGGTGNEKVQAGGIRRGNIILFIQVWMRSRERPACRGNRAVFSTGTAGHLGTVPTNVQLVEADFDHEDLLVAFKCATSPRGVQPVGANESAARVGQALEDLDQEGHRELPGESQHRG
jgi:hypothetical protein